MSKPRKDGSCWEGSARVRGEECELCGKPIEDTPLVRWTFPQDLDPYTVDSLQENGDAPRFPFWVVWLDCFECDYPAYLIWRDELPTNWGPWRRAGMVMEQVMLIQPVFRRGLARLDRERSTP